jgi:hypothetical protein
LNRTVANSPGPNTFLIQMRRNLLQPGDSHKYLAANA